MADELNVGGGAPAPAPEAAPAPAPAPAPAAPPSAPPSAAASRNADGTFAPRAAGDTGDSNAKGPIPYERFHGVNEQLSQWKALGLAPDEAKRVIESYRRAEAEAAAADQRDRQQFERSPEGQRVAQRRDTMLGLLEEALGPNRLASLVRAADNFGRMENDAENTRIRESRDLMTTEFNKVGITFEKPEDAQTWENAVAAHIQHDDRLNALYFDPRSRTQAVAEACARETGRINRILISQGASDLASAAARRATTLRPSRGSSFSSVSEFKPTSNNSTQRRAEWRQEGSRALDAVFAELGL